MPPRLASRAILPAAVACAVACLAWSAAAAERPGYNRDIRPILSENCFGCHGPDDHDRKAGLRLDVPQPDTPPTDSGLAAIVQGKPEESEVIARILSDDPDLVMPPPESNKSLTAAQKETLRRWIEAGAAYEPHWAYLAPVRPAVPAVSRAAWPKNDIDRFVLARLEQEGLAPADEADRSTLIRRVSLDLTGLPPTRAEAEAFLADPSPDAYEKLVDRLLASPHYGERMAVDWLDAARYADTNGYQVDRDRENWPWRDWVIEAFNDNMPFDRFTVEQLAGDLLPSPTREQRIATGFHRNHMLNEEGGIIAEEFLAEYTGDRVETTATVWLGQTFNCCRCHNHKFDPFTQADFYSLKAFFNNVAEKGIGDYDAHVRLNARPFLRLSTPEQEARLADLQAQVAAATKALEAAREAKKQADAQQQAEAKKKEEAKQPEAQQAAAPAPDPVAAAEAQVKDAKKLLAEFEVSIPTALVMEGLPEPRKTFVLMRGDYTNPGAEVTAATPGVLPALAADAPKNRLGLAKWLVAPEHPLAARVTVNRFWPSFFGTGLVATTDDFGSQGSQPSHPELLDWLAVEFRDTGWDMKRLVRLIVTSATYRQRSAFPPGLQERDPANRLLARGPRFRLQAEFVRDQALAAAGLLVPTVGGPSVKPYHPPGLYEQVVTQKDNPKATYEQGSGADLHRRSLYTYWKRSVPHPAMLAFDAPFRETCTVKRSRTNTPMQALTLMNDPTFVEAAKFLAGRMIREGGDAAAGRIAHGFWLVLARPPEAAELALLTTALARFQEEYAAAPAEATALLEIGDAPDDESLAAAAARDLAAYTLVANILLCRDEAVMRN
ncbi:MAG: PSD1 and planctomycete cytochrome C domain-containing protein [Planctomycetia bacterium]